MEIDHQRDALTFGFSSRIKVISITDNMASLASQISLINDPHTGSEQASLIQIHWLCIQSVIHSNHYTGQ